MGNHWYNALGENKYNTSLKDARIFKYLPSVTSVDKMIANTGLDIWKQNIILKTAMMNPQGNFDDKEYMDFIKKEAFADSKRAAKLGNVIHKLAERYISGKSLFFHGQREDVWTLFEPLRNWIDSNLKETESNIIQEYGSEVVLVNERYGFAGKADFYGKTSSDKWILLDYKTTGMTAKDVKKDGNIRKGKIYDSWCRQLAALNHCTVGVDRVVSVIVSSNKDFPGVWIYEWTSKELEKGLREFKAGLELFKSTKKLDI